MMGLHIVIVGGGQAGFQTALSLRQNGHTGPLTMICAENTPPYQRPPLSKDYLQGTLARDRLLFRPQSFYAEHNIDLRLGCAAQALDIKAQRLTLGDGTSLAYDRLVLATGAQARQLDVPGQTLAHIHQLLTVADSDALQAALRKARHWVIVGGGYIGLEVAASARAAGAEVTVLEAAPRVLARVTAPAMSAFFSAQHRAHGVQIIPDAQIDSFIGDTQLRAIALGDGTQLKADIALLGIGVAPNVALAQAAGLDVDIGIRIDAKGQTSQAHIYACGDCTQFHSQLYGRACHLESVQNAVEQGRLVAASLLEQTPPAETTPWFWSTQYDLKLQIAGLSQNYDTVIQRGTPEKKNFALFYLQKQKLIACDAINRPAEFMMCRRLIGAGQTPAPDQLADEACAPKDWV